MDKDKLQWMNHDGSIRKTQFPTQPYHHARTVFADYGTAQATLIELLKDFGLFQKVQTNIMVLQIMEQPIGGLTCIELRALQELAYEAGIPNIIIYDMNGRPLTDEQAQVVHMRQQMKFLKVSIVLIILLVIALGWYFMLLAAV